MIIKKMTASFGCLENETLELHEGLNIITAPNESGKSTWCAFIRAMLYGIDSAQREKGGVKPDKVKYAPWSGAAMAGEMEIGYEGKAITLSRSTKTAAAPMREFSATYTGTGQKLSGLTGKDVGELLTGMPKAVFESSVFVRQAGLAVANSAELEKRINAIISSGEDEVVSYTDADATLRAWLRKRKHNSSGAIPSVEAEIAAKQRQLDSTSDTAAMAKTLEARIAAAEERCAELEEQLKLEKKISGEARLAALNAAADTLEKAKAAREKAAQQAEANAAAQSGIFEGSSADEAEKTLTAELAELERRRKRIAPRFISFALLAIGLILCLASKAVEPPELMYFPGIAILVAAIIPTVLYRLRNNQYEAWAKMLETKYGCSEAEVLLQSLEAYRGKGIGLQNSLAELQKAEIVLAEAEKAHSEAQQSLLSDHGAESPAARGLRAAQDSTAQLRHQLAALQGRIEALGDPMVISSEKYNMKQRLAELQGQYDALCLAITTLREANDEMQQRFSPRLGQRAGEIMQALTGGKYERLSFSRSLTATAKRSSDTVSHDSDFLSSGTADQLYLALRLAICELALPGDKSCPLVLDDALVNFDDERMGYALEALQEIAKTRQVILFTCHDREERYMTAN